MEERKTGTAKQTGRCTGEGEREACWEVVGVGQSKGKLRSFGTGDPSTRVQPSTQYEAQLEQTQCFLEFF